MKMIRKRYSKVITSLDDFLVKPSDSIINTSPLPVLKCNVPGNSFVRFILRFDDIATAVDGVYSPDGIYTPQNATYFHDSTNRCITVLIPYIGAYSPESGKESIAPYLMKIIYNPTASSVNYTESIVTSWTAGFYVYSL